MMIEALSNGGGWQRSSTCNRPTWTFSFCATVRSLGLVLIGLAVGYALWMGPKPCRGLASGLRSGSNAVRSVGSLGKDGTRRSFAPFGSGQGLPLHGLLPLKTHADNAYQTRHTFPRSRNPLSWEHPLTLLTYSRLANHRPRAHQQEQSEPSTAARKMPTVIARWCFDVKYGSKLGALNLVHEWIQHIGSKAGLHEENVRVLSGSIGLKESRVEMEVELPNLGDLEKFWFSIPREQHQDWSQRMADFVVDGSPEWQVLRRVPVRPMSKSSESVSTSQSVSEKQDRDKLDAQLKEWDQSFSEETGIRRSRSPSGSGLAPKGLHQDQLDVDEGYLSSVNLNSGERRIIYDMDGNPIKLNKADSIPALAPENSVTFGNYTFIMPEDYKPFVPPSPDEVFPREKFGSDLFDEPDLDDQDYLPKPPRSS